MPALLRHCEITAAGLDLVSLLGANFHAAERSIFLRIQWNIADVVLAAQFLRDLVECRLKFLRLVPNLNNTPTGFRRKLLHIAIAAKRGPLAPIEPAVGAQQDVNNRIGLLRGFNGVSDFVLASLVF